MVFALPTMKQLYSLEVSPVSSLVQSGICTVGFDDFIFVLGRNIVVLMCVIQEGSVLFLLEYFYFCYKLCRNHTKED